MKVVIQRVSKASVSVDNKTIGSIDKGLLLLSCVMEEDEDKDLDYFVKKIVNMRIFEDEKGLMNKSLIDIKGSILSISQFTLAANTKKGNRPSFLGVKEKNEAKRMYELFNEKLSSFVKVETGSFGADMKIDASLDGPVTINLEN